VAKSPEKELLEEMLDRICEMARCGLYRDCADIERETRTGLTTRSSETGSTTLCSAPVDQPRHFTMNVERDGHGFKFRLYSKPLKRTTNFVGSYQNGTGHLNLTEATVDEDSAAEGLLSRVVLFGSDLRTVDPWGKRLRPVAYAYFERLALELWDRARAKAEDNVVGSSPPDGLWRVVRCRTNPNKKAAVITSAGIFPVT
jgi:hypothetical protein